MINSKKLIQVRKSRNFNQTNIANNCDISQAFYSMIESGKKVATYKVAGRLIDIFGKEIIDQEWVTRLDLVIEESKND